MVLSPETQGLLRDLGIAIRETRVSLKLSQEQLAEAANLHPTYISRIESGRYNMSFQSLNAVCRALKKKVHEVTRQADV